MSSAARKRTEAALGLCATSASLVSSAPPRVRSFSVGPVPGGSIGNPIGAVLRARTAKAYLVIRSSSEWYESTTTRPPGLSVPIAAGNARSHVDSSPLTSMRKA